MLGKIINNRYRVACLLGRGGMATVYKATDLKENRQVALKILNLTSSHEFVKRFKREFNACAGLSHENIVKLYECDLLDDNCPFFTMELLDSPSLLGLIEEKERLSENLVAKIAYQAATAMEYFHSRGIIHRDLKPANLILDAKAHLTIVDFGLASVSTMTALTATGAFLGTPFYMPMEMLNGIKADERSDIFSLGVVLYELLTGQLPFSGDSFKVLFANVRKGAFVPPTRLRSGLSQGWDELCNRCLAPEMSDRYSSAGDLLSAISTVTQRGCSDIRQTEKDRRAKTEIRIKSKKISKFGLRKLVPIASLFLIILLFYKIHQSYFNKKVYAAGDVIIRTIDVQSFEVRWNSRQPYQSRVKLESKKPRIFFSVNRSPVTSHRVLVNDLEEGKSYRVHILFPDGGESLPRTGRTKELSVHNLSSKIDKTGLDIAWRCSHFHNATLTIVYVNREKEEKSVNQSEDGTCSAHISHDTDLLSDLFLNVQYSSSKHKLLDLKKVIKFNLKKAMMVFNRLDPRQVVSKSLELSTPNMNLTCSKLREKPGQPITAEKLRKLRCRLAASALSDILNDKNIISTYNSLYPLLPVILSTRFLGIRERVSTYDALAKLLTLSAYTVCDRFSPPFLLKPFPQLGPFAHYKMMNIDHCTKRVVLYHCNGKKVYLGTAWLSSKREILHGLNMRVVLNKVQRYRRAALTFNMTMFKHFVLCININNNLKLYTFGRGLSMTGRRELCYIRQNIPVEALCNGINTIDVNANYILSYANRDDSRIKKVTIDLWEQ